MGVHFMVKPTDEQRAVISHDRGPALVFAAAGTGKTTTIALRTEVMRKPAPFSWLVPTHIEPVVPRRILRSGVPSDRAQRRKLGL
jgi:hypothetical protein